MFGFSSAFFMLLFHHLGGTRSGGGCVWPVFSVYSPWFPEHAEVPRSRQGLMRIAVC
jgi:hypothetical protein